MPDRSLYRIWYSTADGERYVDEAFGRSAQEAVDAFRSYAIESDTVFLVAKVVTDWN